MALPSAVFGFLLLLSTACVHSFNLIDSLTIKALMRGRHQQQMREAEILDATKGDIINALVTKLTNLMNEQRLNELSKLPETGMEAEQVWPIFARGGDYGPRYDMLEDGEIDESNDDEENDFEKRSAAEIFVDALTKKDLESLLHQPDPSLTVQELPQNPQISFRKGSHILDQNTIASEETTVTPPFQGMKEVIRESRSSSNLVRSPILLSKQLRSLKQIN